MTEDVEMRVWNWFRQTRAAKLAQCKYYVVPEIRIKILLLWWTLLSLIIFFSFFSFLFFSCLVCLSVWLSVCLSVCPPFAPLSLPWFQQVTWGRTHLKLAYWHGLMCSSHFVSATFTPRVHVRQRNTACAEAIQKGPPNDADKNERAGELVPTPPQTPLKLS